MACRLPSLSLRTGFLAGSNLFSLSSSGFHRRRFGTFCGCGLAWRGHESCCCSAFSEALPKHLFVGYQVFCCAKVSFQSPFCWVCLVAYRLPSLSLCALGSNLAAVPLFRMRFSMANFGCEAGCGLVSMGPHLGKGISCKLFRFFACGVPWRALDLKRAAFW